MLPQRAAQRSNLSADVLGDMLEHLRANFDARHGGFGGAPKFPHPAALELCQGKGAADMALLTLTRMCEGGIYDQLGGGFCRYTWTRSGRSRTSRKCSTTTARAAVALRRLARQSGPAAARCVDETAAWIMREMQSPEGGYYSSLDADSEHEEGKFSVWDRDAVKALLSGEEYREVAAHYGLDQPPNFENRHWHLRVVLPCQNEILLQQAKRKLFLKEKSASAWARREDPGVMERARDPRHGARRTGVRARGLDSLGAPRAAIHPLENVARPPLLATYKDGRAHLNAYLDDYAFLVALCWNFFRRSSPWKICNSPASLRSPGGPVRDRENGGFFFTAREHESLIHRPNPATTMPRPPASAAAAWGVGRLAALTGEERYARAAERTLELFYPVMRAHPAGSAAWRSRSTSSSRPPAP